jgi:hypothetical protein
MGVWEGSTRGNKLTLEGAVFRVDIRLLLFQLLPGFIFTDVVLLLFSGTAVLEPVLHAMVSSTVLFPRKALRNRTHIYPSIVYPHRLGKSLLGDAVGLVVLLKLGLEDLDLFLGKARLRFCGPRHLMVMNKMVVLILVCLHGVG